MEKREENLTNEALRSRFENPFDLVNYAINLGRQMVRSGRDCRVDTKIQNRCYQVLLEIFEGEDQLEDVTEENPAQTATSTDEYKAG